MLFATFVLLPVTHFVPATCVDGLIHNGNTAWVSDSTFGDVKTYTKADFKSLAFSSLLLNDLMISDPSGHIGFTDVLDGQTMQSKMRGYWGCQTVPQVFPGPVVVHVCMCAPWGFYFPHVRTSICHLTL